MPGPSRVQLELYPQLPFGGADALRALLDAFESAPAFAPTGWGMDERERVRYNRAAVVERTPTGADSIGLVYLHRDKAVPYTAALEFGRFPSVSVAFGVEFPAARWDDLLALADRLAAAVRARFGVVHAFRPKVTPWVTEEDRVQLWMSSAAQPTPLLFRLNGPLSLGMRTYFGGDVLALFGRARLLSTPGVVRELEWGGVCVDLADDLWHEDPASLRARWTRAMEHLAPAEATATPVFLKSGRAVDFTPSPAWARAPRGWNWDP
jgi:hypothetical protein